MYVYVYIHIYSYMYIHMYRAVFVDRTKEEEITNKVFFDMTIGGEPQGRGWNHI
jgi:hypothetical protein